MYCALCDGGDEPMVLDIDGVLSSLSGKPGCWAHAYEDEWQPCQRKAAEEHAIVDKLPKAADGVPVVPGPQTLWEWCRLRREAREVRPSNPGYLNSNINFSSYYSTQAAAQAAKEGE